MPAGVIKCKAAVCWEKDAPISMEEIEVAPPKAHEIRIKVIAAGLCHSDLSAWKGNLPFVRFPTVLGHEASGIVESVGEGVTSVKEGDHVLPSFLPHCRECPMCQSDDSNLCLKFFQPPDKIGCLGDGTTRISCGGVTLYHFIGCSTFAEYAVIPEGSFNKINENAPLENVCILSCGITTGYGGPVKLAKVKPGSTCAVFGLGTVGLSAVMGCKVQGASRIIGVDLNSDKREIAEKFGITDFLNPNQINGDVDKKISEMTNGGCDYTFECIGNVGVMKTALNSCKVGHGKCIVIGVPPVGHQLQIDPYQLLFGRLITGCFLGGFRNEEVPSLVEDYLNKRIMVDEFITHRFTLDEINEAMRYMRECISVKSVMTP